MEPKKEETDPDQHRKSISRTTKSKRRWLEMRSVVHMEQQTGASGFWKGFRILQIGVDERKGSVFLPHNIFGG